MHSVIVVLMLDQETPIPLGTPAATANEPLRIKQGRVGLLVESLSVMLCSLIQGEDSYFDSMRMSARLLWFQ